MRCNRRDMIKFSAAGAATLVVGGYAASAAPMPIDDIRSSALAYFGKAGFVELPPLSLITDHAFNGGLRYDDTRPAMLPHGWISIQPATRIEDIAERHRPGVLAGFTIIGLQGAPGDERGALFDRMIDFLVEARGLDAGKMLFVSTELFRPHVERSDRVRADRVVERPLAEAQAAGDGSGYFAPKGHPYQPKVLSVGVYYPLSGAAQRQPMSYPPQGYIEIAEIDISPENDKPKCGGIGLERLAMAEGKPIPDFERSRRDLLRAIEAEARRTGKPLPPGYATFAAP